MKAELDPAKRNERAVLVDEKQKRRNMLIQLLDESLSDWTDQIFNLFREDLVFREEAIKIIETLVPNVSLIKVKTTWGPQESNTMEYIGTFVKHHSKGLFSMMNAEGGTFSVGSSCLYYIEVLNVNE